MTTKNNSQHYDVYRVEKLLQSFSSYINSFDGSPHAFANNAEKIMSEVFHKDWIFITDDGPKDLQWYRNFCKSFAEHGSIAKVLDFSQTVNGIQVTIANTINGVEVDPITYDGLVSIDENGQYKIKYFEPVINKGTNKSRSLEPFDKNLRNVERMIQLVSECDSSPSKD